MTADRAGSAPDDDAVAEGFDGLMAQVAAAESALQALPFVTAVERSPEHGREAALSVHGVSRLNTPFVLQTLVGAGINIFSAMADDASLEDVYFALQAEQPHGANEEAAQ